MSGVLDRMAQRALGAPQAAQPLMAPRYAGMRAEPHGTAPAPERPAGLETTAEIETIASAPAREGDVRNRSVAESGNAARRQQDEPGKSLEVRGLVNRPETLEMIAKRQEQATPTSRLDDLGGRQSLPIGRASQFSSEVEAELRPAQAGNRSETAPAAKAVPHLDRMEPRRENAKAEPMRENRETYEIEGALSRKDETLRHETIRSLEFPNSNRVAAPPLAANSQRMLQGERLAAEEKPEIHISIGSIELRAPRSEARSETRPPAAPFRPRVTLDDFLHRGRETRP